MEAIVTARPEERENSDRRRRQEKTLTPSDSTMDGIGILFIAAHTKGEKLISLEADDFIGSSLSMRMSTDKFYRVIATINGGQGALFQILNKEGQTIWTAPNAPNK